MKVTEILTSSRVIWDQEFARIFDMLQQHVGISKYQGLCTAYSLLFLVVKGTLLAKIFACGDESTVYWLQVQNFQWPTGSAAG